MIYSNSESQNIQSQIYKIQQIKKKKEKQEICKYPALNGQLNENNLLSNFIFDNNENNLINNEKNLEINYDICSYMNNDEIPDLYTPFGLISGDKYHIIPIKIEKLENLENSDENFSNKNEENEKKIEEIKSNIQNDNNYELKKIIRYFDINYKDTKIDINNSRCKKCGKFGHLKCDCTNFVTSCHICLSKDHTKKYCPKLVRCSNCFEFGHSAQDCQKTLDSVCENCKITIHNREDCLKCPIKIYLKDLRAEKLSCVFCGSEEHLVCPFSKKKNLILLYEITNKDIENDIDIDMNKKDFSQNLFCPNCKENHLRKECKIKKDNWTNNDNKSEIKSIISDNKNNSINDKNEDFWGSENEVLKLNNQSRNKGSQSTENEIKTSINYEFFKDWGTSLFTTTNLAVNNNNKEINNNKDNQLTNDKKENDNYDNKSPNSESKKIINGYYNQKNYKYFYNNDNNQYSYNKNYNHNSFHKNYIGNKNISYYNYKEQNYRNHKNNYYNDDQTNYFIKCISLKEEENNYEEKNNNNSHKYKTDLYKSNNYTNNKYNNYYYKSNIYEDYIKYKKKKNK